MNQSFHTKSFTVKYLKKHKNVSQNLSIYFLLRFCLNTCKFKLRCLILHPLFAGLSIYKEVLPCFISLQTSLLQYIVVTIENK